MSTYARIAGGIVAELFTPPSGVPIADCFNAALTWVECDATPGVSPGWTYASGTFTAPAAPPAPTAAQLAAVAYAAFIAGGITVTSTGTPALDGVYAIDAGTQTSITTEAAFIATFSEFSTGSTTAFPWQLQNGTWVSFPTTAEFLAFAKAVGQTVTAANIALKQAAAMPSASITIA